MTASEYWRTPLDLDRWKVRKATVEVLAERCKGCGLCVDYCPTHVLVFSERSNRKGYHFPVVARGQEAACVCCGYCQSVCPDFAIYLEAIAEEVSP